MVGIYDFLVALTFCIIFTHCCCSKPISKLDPLESEEELVTTLEMFATVARSKYAESGRFILTEFKDHAKKYRELIQRLSNMANGSPIPNSSDIKDQLVFVEMQLTWMVYIIGACVGGRIVSVCILEFLVTRFGLC